MVRLLNKACGKLFGGFEIDKSKQAESLSYITCDRVTYVVSWLNDMKAVSETVMSSSPLDIMVTEEMSWMSDVCHHLLDIAWMSETEALALQILIFLAVLQLKTLLVGQAAPWYGIVTSNAPY